MNARSISPGVRTAVLERDGFRCRRCGHGVDDGVRLVIDHIVPVARGGGRQIANLQTLCDPCNAGKAAREPHEHDLRPLPQAATPAVLRAMPIDRFQPHPDDCPKCGLTCYPDAVIGLGLDGFEARYRCRCRRWWDCYWSWDHGVIAQPDPTPPSSYHRPHDRFVWPHHRRLRVAKALLARAGGAA